MNYIVCVKKLILIRGMSSANVVVCTQNGYGGSYGNRVHLLYFNREPSSSKKMLVNIAR